MSVDLDRKCGKCGFDVKQYVSFEEKDGRITITVYLGHCPICKGFLKTPTPGEVRRALLIKEAHEVE